MFSIHYGKNARCRATTFCRVLAHGKEYFVVQRKQKTHGKEQRTAKRTYGTRQR
jgi:hypothetical protein